MESKSDGYIDRGSIFVQKFQRRFGNGFEYVGGYKDSKSLFDVRCKRCGSVFKRTAQVIRRPKQLTCFACVERKTQQSRPVFITSCKWCGKEIRTTFKNQLVCSSECRRLYQNARHVAEYQSNRSEQPKRKCKWCGKEFNSWKRTAYCSDECRDAADKDRRKLQNRKRQLSTNVVLNNGVHWNPISIKRLWVRDGGKCGICGKTVNLKLCRGGPGNRIDMMAATVDHIIPLACGGSHTWDNVRLAHFMCNSKRGTGGNAQTLLFG